MAPKSDIGSVSSRRKITEISFTVGVSCVLSVAYFGGIELFPFSPLSYIFRYTKIVVNRAEIPNCRLCRPHQHDNLHCSSIAHLNECWCHDPGERKKKVNGIPQVETNKLTVFSVKQIAQRQLTLKRNTLWRYTCCFMISDARFES